MANQWGDCDAQAAVSTLKLVAALHERSVLLPLRQQNDEHLCIWYCMEDMFAIFEGMKDAGDNPKLQVVFKNNKAYLLTSQVLHHTGKRVKGHTAEARKPTGGSNAICPTPSLLWHPKSQMWVTVIVHMRQFAEADLCWRSHGLLAHLALVHVTW